MPACFAQAKQAGFLLPSALAWIILDRAPVDLFPADPVCPGLSRACAPITMFWS